MGVEPSVPKIRSGSPTTMSPARASVPDLAPSTFSENVSPVTKGPTASLPAYVLRRPSEYHPCGPREHNYQHTTATRPRSVPRRSAPSRGMHWHRHRLEPSVPSALGSAGEYPRLRDQSRAHVSLYAPLRHLRMPFKDVIETLLGEDTKPSLTWSTNDTGSCPVSQHDPRQGRADGLK